MHIEPHIVNGAKLILSYITGVGSLGFAAKLMWDSMSKNTGCRPTVFKSIICITIFLALFQLLPHPNVGVSEVHLILGSTLFFLFGVVPTAVGLAGSLLVQGVLFAPFDLPQYGMNVTTLLASLFVMHKLAKKIIAPNTPYIDLSYKQVFKLSVVFQAGIVSWVGFWNFYGQGFSPNSITNIALFAASYLPIVFIEPIIDLAVLHTAKTMSSKLNTSFFNARLFS